MPWDSAPTAGAGVTGEKHVRFWVDEPWTRQGPPVQPHARLCPQTHTNSLPQQLGLPLVATAQRFAEPAPAAHQMECGGLVPESVCWAGAYGAGELRQP